MHRQWSVLTVALLLAALPQAIFAQTLASRISLVLLGPDAKPIPHADIIIYPTDIEGPAPGKTISAQTDDQGRVDFPAPVGRVQFDVQAPGHGYARTGIVEVRTDLTTPGNLPPLAPFAHVTGKLPDSLLHQPGPPLSIIAQTLRSRTPVTKSSDAAGNFDFDLTAAQWSIFVRRGPVTVASQTFPLVTVPGERIEVLPLTVVVPDQNSGVPFVPATRPGVGQQVPWIKGVVRDSAGKPIPGATVYAAASIIGRRESTLNLSAQTAPDGTYQITGRGGQSTSNIAVIASIAGKPPAWAWTHYYIQDFYIPQGTTTAPSKIPAPQTVDLVIPDKGGELSVSVLSNGKPLQNGGVILSLEEAGRSEFATGAVQAIASPFAATDADGRAHFENLLPGRYTVTAGEGNEQTIRNIQYRSRPLDSRLPPFGVAEGIPVRTGETTSFKLGVYPQNFSTALHGIRHDGGPITGAADMDVYKSWSTNIGFDDAGNAALHLGAYGWFTIRAEYIVGDLQMLPIQPPYFAFDGNFAISPSLTVGQIPTFTAIPMVPPAIEADVRDAADKPVHTVVEYGSWMDTNLWGTTDEKGHVTLTGLESRINPLYSRVRAMGLDVPKGILEPNQSFAIPPDSAFPAQDYLMEPVAPQINQTVHVTIHPQKVAWIKGKLTPRPGQESRYLELYTDTPSQTRGAVVKINRETHEFAAGPFAGTSTRLAVSYTSTDPLHETFREFKEVPLTPGQISHIDFTGPDSSANVPNLNDPDLLAASVFLPDGKTPALGAQLALYRPESKNAAFIALTDFNGIAHFHYSQLGDEAAPEIPGSPQTAVIIAQLPGSYGAVMAAPAKPGESLRLVLPPARSVEGQVLVGSERPTDRPGHIRVAAIFQGQGRLAPAFSITTTADVDGHFELAGLSPGVYQVQAALDDVWFSQPETITVGAAALEALGLLIPAPGAPVRLTVVDAQGKPAVGQAVTIDHTGPLAQTLFPEQWLTDGAGILNIPTLETGHHTLRLAGSNDKTEIDVPPMGAKTVDAEIKSTPGPREGK